MSKEIRKLCRFKGKDGSLGYKRGYKRGSAYLLTLEESRSRADRLEITVFINSYNGSRCAYSSWDKFLENWDIIG